MSTTADLPQFLREFLDFPANADRTCVTLTFAQSVDAKIAGKNGQQITLSCKESMLMTHWMRSMHDAILVGIGTALNDNPQLNTRLLPAGERHASPQPIILDSGMRFRSDSKLMKNWAAGTGRQPIIFTKISDGDLSHAERVSHVEEKGAIVRQTPTKNGRLSLDVILNTIYEMGFKSLMVEGGASVIASFLDSQHVDRLLITVSPTFVGSAGVTYECPTEQVSLMENVATRTVGVDTVLGWKKKL